MELQISSNESNQRLDRFLRKYFKPHPEIKLADIYAWLRNGSIKLNGKKAKENNRISEGDRITRDDTLTQNVSLSAATRTKEQKIQSFSLQNITPYILYEDDHWIRRNKPADMVTHPGNKHTTDLSLHDLMQSYLNQTAQKKRSMTFNPSFCFRLDKDTSGIIISAKTYEALQFLNKAIRERQTKKHYLAIVEGIVTKKMVVNKPLFIGYDKKSGKAKTFINEEKGKESHSTVMPISTRTDPVLWPISIVDVEITTGRMHQIRVHLDSIWHAVIGDITYGNNALNRLLAKNYRITRQLLHCRTYGFYDELQNKELFVKAPLPAEFIMLFPDLWDNISSKKPSRA